MVELKINKEKTIVSLEGKSTEEFFKNPRNIGFFTSNGGFGFEIRKKGNKIIWEGMIEDERELNGIIDFMKDEKQKVKADSSVKKITTKRKQKEKRY